MLGLAITTAVGLMLGALNLISVAFAVLFVGLGVDFGIQFSVRYRAERYENDDLAQALAKAAESSAVPLTLAAVATAVGFLSFLPTDYKGVSELGKIAGAGMLIAFLEQHHGAAGPAQAVQSAGREGAGRLRVPGAGRPFMKRHRIAIIVGTLVLAIAGLPLLYYLQFDFNPMNLRSSKVESVATYLDMRKDPKTGANAINVMAPSRQPTPRRSRPGCEKVPEVDRVDVARILRPGGPAGQARADPQAARRCSAGVQPDRSSRARPTRRTSRR